MVVRQIVRCLMLSAVLSATSLAQQPYVEVSHATRTLAGTRIEPRVVKRDGNGNYYVASVETFMDGGQKASFVVTKFSAAGALLWTRSYPRNIVSVLGSFEVSQDGHSFICGQYGTQTATHALLICYDTAGVNTWVKRKFGAPGYGASGSGLVLMPDQTVTWSGGYGDGFWTFGSFFERVSAAGAVLWTRLYAAKNLMPIELTTDEAGYIYGFGDNFDNTLYFCKLTGAGGLIFDKTLVQPNHRNSYRAKGMSEDGFFFVAGTDVDDQLSFSGARFSSLGGSAFFKNFSPGVRGEPKVVGFDYLGNAYVLCETQTDARWFKIAANGTILQSSYLTNFGEPYYIRGGVTDWIGTTRAYMLRSVSVAGLASVDRVGQVTAPIEGLGEYGTFQEDALGNVAVAYTTFGGFAFDRFKPYARLIVSATSIPKGGSVDGIISLDTTSYFSDTTVYLYDDSGQVSMPGWVKIKAGDRAVRFKINATPQASGTVRIAATWRGAKSAVSRPIN